MGTHSDHATADSLLAQAGWLRALSRHLVRDPNAAEDVAQETLISALASPPPADRPTRPWLGRIARNVARMRSRSETARERREREQVGETEALSAAELAEKLEAQQLLVSAVRDLAEPYRSTILLHYWEHKTSEEIAALHGVAAATARWRLAQAVESLRERLDARHGGDRSAWSAALAPLATLPNLTTSGASTGAATSVTILAGVLTMKLFTQLALGAVLLVALTGGAWFLARPLFLGDTDALPPLSNERVAVEFKPIDPVAVGLEPATSSSATRVGVGAPRPAGSAAVEAVARLEGRIVDEHARPIRGVQFSRVRPDSTVVASSDGEGRIAAELPLSFDHDSILLVARAAAFATRTLDVNLQRGRTTFLGDVEMKPGGAISGRVVDAAGAPVRGARVGVDKVDVPRSELQAGREDIDERDGGEVSTICDAEGHFRLDGVASGLSRAVAWSPNHLRSHSGIVEVRAGQESAGVTIEIESIPADRIVRGVVLDPDGAPVPHANVSCRAVTRNHSSSGSRNADANGRFRFLVRPGSAVELVSHDDEERWRDAAAVDVKASDHDVVLQFQAARRFELVVSSSTGRPLEVYTGSCQTPDHRSALSRIPLTAHAEGRTQILLPSTTFVVMLTAPGHQELRLGPYEPAAVPASIAVTLQALPGVRGLVRSDAGPVSGARVRLFEQADRRIEHDDFPVAVIPDAVDEALTAADGSFTLTARRDATYVVRAESAGFAAAESGWLRVDAARGTTGVEVRMTPGGSIEGRVVSTPGRDALGTIVAISRGDGFACTQRVGPDSAYRFDRLMPGRWMVKVVDEEISPDGSSPSSRPGSRGEIPWNCEVFEGRVTRFDLGGASSSSNACTLAGELEIVGAERGVWKASIEPNGASESAGTTLEPQGSFRLQTNEPKRARVLVTALDGPFDGTRMLDEVDLHAGEQSWKATLRASRLVVRGARPASGEREPLVLLVSGGGTWLCVRPVPDEGDLDLVVPSGNARLLRLRRVDGMDPDPRKWTGGVEFTLTPGGTTTVERP